MKHRTLLSVVVLLIFACDSHGDGEGGADEYFYDCEDSRKPANLMVYATDEAYRAFLDKVTASGFKKDSTQAPQLMSPAPDATLSLSSPPAFSFSNGMTLRTKDLTPNPRLAPRRSRWAWLKRALSFEGTAWAHCPTVTGPLFLLQLTPAGAQEPAYTALASVTSFTPGAAAWKEKLQPHAGKKVTLTLARGVFSQGHLELGPFVADREISFTLGQ